MKKIFGDTIKVFLSNFIVLISGIVAGFAIPKIMGLNDYGMYKTFTLYTAYTGLFQIGFLDGIAVKFGGKDYESLDRNRFSSYFSFFFLSQLLFGLIIFLLAYVCFSNNYKMAIYCLAVYLVIMNTTCFFQAISKITMRFNELAIRNVLQALMILVVIAILYGTYRITNVEIKYQTYIAITLAIYGILLIWYLYTYKEIAVNKQGSLSCDRGELYGLIKSGVPVMVANLCSTLILTLDRQFVSVLFTTEVYAVYAFAYTMLSLTTTMISAVSTVIYPNLKRIETTVLTQKYSKLVSGILILSSAAFIVFYPTVYFVNWFLPKYSGSIAIFRIVLPGIVISSVISIVIQNYYIALDKGKIFFRITLVALCLAFASNCIAYIVFKSPYAISLASVITTLLWYILSDRYFIKTYNIGWRNIYIYIILNVVAFYLLSNMNNLIIGGSLNLLVYFFLSGLLYWLNVKKSN